MIVVEFGFVGMARTKQTAQLGTDANTEGLPKVDRIVAARFQSRSQSVSPPQGRASRQRASSEEADVATIPVPSTAVPNTVGRTARRGHTLRGRSQGGWRNAHSVSLEHNRAILPIAVVGETRGKSGGSKKQWVSSGTFQDAWLVDSAVPSSRGMDNRPILCISGKVLSITAPRKNGHAEFYIMTKRPGVEGIQYRVHKDNIMWPIPLEFLNRVPAFLGMSSAQGWWKNLTDKERQDRLHVTSEVAKLDERMVDHINARWQNK